MRKLCVEIGMLLGTANDLLRDKGWTAVQKKGMDDVLQPTDCNLRTPRKWLPYSFCRLYTHEQHKGRLLFVAVVLDNRDSQAYEVPVDEPILTAGFYCCAKAIPDSDWNCLLCEWPLWRRDAPDQVRRADPQVTPYRVPDDWREEYPGLHIEEFHSLACPLTSITDSTKLKELIERLRELCEHSSGK
jgi:hypothetical protein